MDEMERFDFITKTDRRSLRTQIKMLVECGMAANIKDLEARRNRLKILLETEEKIFEDEFSNTVKERVAQDVSKRQKELLIMREKRNRDAEEFVRAKRIQQDMNNCIEIRDNLRHKELMETKESQFEQMLDKERSVARQKQLDNYWHQIKLKHVDEMLKAEKEEKCLKKQIIEENKKILFDQMAELRCRQAQEVAALRKEREILAEKIEKLNREDAERLQQKKLATIKDIKSSLEDARQYKQKVVESEKEEERKYVENAIYLWGEDPGDVVAKRETFRKATLEYLEYVRRMHEFEANRDDQRLQRIKEIAEREYCVRDKRRLQRQRKAEEAKKAHKILLQQMCEQHERRLREEAEQREYAFPDNPFGKWESPKGSCFHDRRRRELELQIQQMNAIRAKEERRYQDELTTALHDRNACLKLAEKYSRERIDYLPPHPNWLLYACAKQSKPAQQAAKIEMRPPSPTISDSEAMGDGPSKCPANLCM